MVHKALNRRPDLTPRKSFMLDDNTKIEEIGITVRMQNEIGLHGIAAKILVNGAPIVYDDLLDCFTTEELVKITDFLFPEAGKGSDEKNG